MITLYHYTKLFNLPPILSDGLARGDVPHPDPSVREVAVNLTTQADPDTLNCWSRGMGRPRLHLAVRCVCPIDPADPLLEPARRAMDRLAVPPVFRRRLDPSGQSKWWYLYHGVIPADRLVVQLRTPAGYVEPHARQLAELAARVAAERATYTVERHPVFPTAVRYIRSAATSADEWLASAALLGDVVPLGANQPTTGNVG